MMTGYLSLGSNMGDMAGNLRATLDALPRLGVEVLKRSDIYETKAVEVSQTQDPYMNMAVHVKTEAEPLELLDVCQKIEYDLHRRRDYYHCPRTIDIDILLLEGVTIKTDRLKIPHPRMETRQFVIHPLMEIAPDLVLSSGRKIKDVKNALGNDEIIGIWMMDDG